MLEICKLLLFFLIGFYTFKWMNINKCSQILKFIFWAVFFRFVLAAFHEVTFLAIFGSFSIISIYSILLVCVSFVFMSLKKIPVILNSDFYLIKLMILLMALSAIINSNEIQSIASIIKWIFILQLSLMLIESIKYNGIAKVLKVISIAYMYPILLVIFSIILGVSKATELDGSISYIGGYYHEGVISVLILSAMSIFVLMASEQSKRSKQLYLVIFFWFLLVMINYRTTLLASLLIGPFVLLAIYKNSQTILNKSIIVLLVLIIPIGIVMLGTSNLFERFQEIPDAISQFPRFLNFQEYYSQEDRQFFSGRIYIWSGYIAAALDGSEIQLLFGQGMDSWTEYFDLYAHNSFVSYFYELGIVGLGIFTILIINVYRKILKIRNSGISLSLCGVYSAFIVLNLGTMPLWQLEGIILFSLIIAITEHYTHREENETEKQTIHRVHTSGSRC